MITPNHRSKSDPEQQFPTVQEMQKEFSRKVSNLLLPNHPSGTAFLNFIWHYLYIWNMRDIDPKDILAGAVYQGLKFIQTNGQPIEIPKAWLRGTCLNLLKNQMRATIKYKKLSECLKESSSETESPLTIVERFEWLDNFYEAIKQLPPDEQELVQLRLFDEKTYEQIYHWMELRDGQAPDIPTIRKRYSRAVTRLKKIFPAVYQDDLA
jgi:RNA polymerase sigma factor (sigma-70 family)